MKRFLGILLVLVLGVFPGAGAETSQTELIVFAAASLTEALTEIERLYEAEHPETDLVFNFDSSGTLKTQIREGADCDVFLSAGQKQMNELDITKDEETNPERLDFVAENSRTDLLENKVALVLPDDPEKEITGFDSLAQWLRDGELLMAMGNSDVPVGQYTRKILEYYGLDEDALAAAGKISYGSNVKEVTTQVKEGSVDCGIVYATDAFSAGLEIRDTATAEMCGQVIYPAAVMKHSRAPEAARAFLEYLRGEAAMTVFEQIGFTGIRTEAGTQP